MNRVAILLSQELSLRDVDDKADDGDDNGVLDEIAGQAEVR